VSEPPDAAQQNILVVLLEEGLEEHVREAVGERSGAARVRVVAPTHAGLLSWYATDEQRDRAEASGQSHAHPALAAVESGRTRSSLVMWLLLVSGVWIGILLVLAGIVVLVFWLA
jgi:hypothetical protein